MNEHRIPQHINGFRVDNPVYTALNRPAVLDKLREDGKFDAHYEDGPKWSRQTILNPKDLKHRP